jgi:hypothetical protein
MTIFLKVTGSKKICAIVESYKRVQLSPPGQRDKQATGFNNSVEKKQFRASRNKPSIL